MYDDVIWIYSFSATYLLPIIIAVSWAAPNHALDHLDVTHRKRNHLRDIIGNKWPRGHISNDKLYERCSTRSLSERVCAARWKMQCMLGHVLRYDDDTPALLALKFCIFTEGCGSGFKGRRGAPRICTYEPLKCF